MNMGLGFTIPPSTATAAAAAEATGPYRRLRFISQPGPIAAVADFPLFRSARTLAPQLFHAAGRIPAPINNYYLYSSTDHDVSGDGGGIYLWTGPTPQGPFTPFGTLPVYVDTSSGLQTEFPSIGWDPISRQVFLYYIFNISSTALAVSADGVTFERIGEVVLPPASGYTGYPTVSKLGANAWVMSHLAWGGDQGRYGLSRSPDGLVWVKDPMEKTGQAEVPLDLNYKSHGPAQFFRVNGEMWGLGAARVNAASGGQAADERAVAGPVTADLHRWARTPERCWTPQAPWEQGGFRSAGRVFVDDDASLWLTYRGGDGTSIGIAKGTVIDGEAA